MSQIADRLLQWYDRHGRHDLPWQQPRSPYRVWVSEVMLQQTQVTTVIDYFQSFMRAFPDLKLLAGAHEDEVLRLWAGLGYYSRARNLHKAAQLCEAQHAGRLPVTLDGLMALPGIGRSTAGAILAQSHGMAHPILDGNAKRVLARYFAVAGWPGQSAVARRLWQLAEQCLPDQRVADYTQAIMDLGASVCRSRGPACADCPLQGDCAALAANEVASYPGRKARSPRPLRHAWLLLVSDEKGRLLVERRAGSGIWGGLWCLPVVDARPDRIAREAATIEHGFTHFRLNLVPVQTAHGRDTVADRSTRWCGPAELDQLGMPRPVRVFLDEYFAGEVRWQGFVQCVILGCEAEGLDFQPYPGALGERIFNQVSKPAWGKWLAHQTMLINENRLTPIDPAHRKFLEAEMEKFLFGDGSETGRIRRAGISVQTARESTGGKMDDRHHSLYWRANLRLLALLLVIWFVVSFGFGILLKEQLDAFQFFGFKLGFWWAQQGSIYVFLVLIGVYAVAMNRLDRKFDVDEE